ncbi:Palmdelphin [Bagarius yarrelli]|uniref:Palmdelphin n=1 Tax=Bagarius yarrelli TaxID=175774 RepID=A0A556TQ72_BAGYA|nr:Palmdelphin [Bagarius yarrelli]
MEEADLLRERLQAITEKRRIQEDIAKKRREIEEEKLKLQYLKKKSLREQWLMDGLSVQNEQEEEAVRAQAQEAQQQTMLLQQQIHRIEHEIEDLETEEMNISANEELILKRLKEVERTAEDIIKEVNGDEQRESIQYIYSAIPDIPKSYTPNLMRRINTPVKDSGSEAEKKAMYAMEISVEKDLRTGKSQVLSSATVIPQEFQQKGIKVYDDGMKSVYAIQSAGKEPEDTLDEMSSLEVDELLKNASAKKDQTDVKYHQPVFSSPYSSSSTPQKAELGSFSPGPKEFHILSKTPSPFQSDIYPCQCQEDGKVMRYHSPDHIRLYMNDNDVNRHKVNITQCCDGEQTNEASLEEVEQKRLIPVSDSYLGFERLPTFYPTEDDCYSVDNSFPSEMDCGEPVTMIFMGYQNAESDEENDAIQAELVVIGNDEEEDDEESSISYHPQGYRSKIFQPRNKNIHRSEIRNNFIKSSNPGEHHTKHRTQYTDTSVCEHVTKQQRHTAQLLAASHTFSASRVSVATGKSISIALSTLLLPQSKGAAASRNPESGGTEVNEYILPIENQTQPELNTIPKTVTMETTEQPSTGNIPDYEMEIVETTLFERKDRSAEDEQQVYNDDILIESLSAKVADAILADLPPTVTNGDEFKDMPTPKEALILDDTNVELNRNESITSSVSDTPSSAESMYENEAMQKQQDSVKEELLRSIAPVLEDADDVDMLDPLKDELHEDFLDGLGCEVDKSMLESFIREEVMSDISNESGQNPEDFEECLMVEIAAASSDSETDEKWRTIFSSSINKEDDDSYLDSLQLSAQELFIQKAEVKTAENHLGCANDVPEEDVPEEYVPEEDVPKEYVHEEDVPEEYVPEEDVPEEYVPEEDVPEEDAVLEQPETSTYIQPTREISYNPSTVFHGLSKISEDEQETGRGSVNHNDFSSTCVKSDSNKKIPKDYCVIQEMKSENVSTEHVDFKVARNQWLQIEEQTKNFTHQPVIRTGTCQGNHSFMYTPVRNIDRQKKDAELENLPLGKEYHYTQFSPCSEDSGVDDSSFRSPYDEPETPVEKALRSIMEKEEILKHEKEMSKSYLNDCVQGKGNPVILNPGKLCQEVDEKRKMLEHQEDDFRSSIQMPSFIITSSPTRSQKHKMAANNIIILEPESCHQSPRHAGKLVSSKSADWRPDENPSVIILETSNLIIRSASELNLNSASVVAEEKTFLNNPFFKLRSRSTLSLVDEEIKIVKQREEELKKERASIYTKENFLASPKLLDSPYDKQDDFLFKCKSSPSSPMKTYKMDRSTLSCDHRFPEAYFGGRRKSAMALRWEAGEFANH